MYIKSIVIDGFKSYGQRTEITGFDPLFNAITGLNGTGKSNILDSICFVLGISNLTHVRASTMQDLIFKSGQAGINKATVSITFDNRNPAQCPSGFEQTHEITITRQIALGGKNKYMINGINVTGKKIQDLFCSVQLNVNNPHFLIMQGRITKVLGMKAPEIMSMVEEAAGTKMYETKRQLTQKVIEKKDSKLAEFQAVINEELSPKLEKLKADREQYLEYQRIERELEHLLGVFQVWQFYEAERNYAIADEALKKGQQKITNIDTQIKENVKKAKTLDAEVENIAADTESEIYKELKNLEEQLKVKEKQEAKVNASVKAIKDNISTEVKKQKQLEKTVANDEKTLNAKENELSKVQSLFETLKENDRLDTEAYELSEKKFEAVCAGMEVNDQGEAETLAEQLMNAKEEASKASTESKQASMQLTFCENQLKAKQKDASTNSGDYEKDQVNLKKTEKEVAQLENSMKRINFSEERMTELQTRRRAVNHEIRNLTDQVERFQASRPYTSFQYRDPEPNFNKASVKGVVCKLFTLKDNIYATALETAAGGKLYNVVVDTDVTSKKLLQRGDLQNRTTFIPLNKIAARRMDQQTINYAQSLVGKENCQPAIALINYDSKVQTAMEFIFGDVFICKDIDVARKITFNDRIRKRCITLDGDSTDPYGTLSGGAKQKGDSILTLIGQIQVSEALLQQKEQELSQIDREMGPMNGAQEQYNAIKYKLDMAHHELNLIKQRLMNTTFARQQEEVEGLKTQIGELRAKVKSCLEIENKCSAKAKDLEVKMKDTSGYKEKRLKEAEADMKKAKAKADKSKKEWRQREQDYETLTLEIQELKKGIATVKEQIAATQENIRKLHEECEGASVGSNEAKEAVSEIQEQVKIIKSQMAEKNKERQGKIKKKEQLLSQNNELQLEIKKLTHELKDLSMTCKSLKHKEQEYEKKMSKNNIYLEKGKALSREEGLGMERKIKTNQERKNKLGRTINTQAQSMFEVEEKKFDEMMRKQKIVQADRRRLLKSMAELDKKKENALKIAYEQVSKDFGSIFNTLLPGANAKLIPLQTKNTLSGLEIKVSLGNVWKESLTELSGGQRSLAALSLILAMLLFKPAPLYILDEVDAALDLSHTQNIGNMLKSHFKKSQFIVVSLKDGMFNNANVLFRTKFVDGVSAVQRTENNRR